MRTGAADRPRRGRTVPEGSRAADRLLQAYAEGGLLLITSAQAPQTGAAADSSSCCGNPAYPNLPPLPEEPPGEGGVKKTGGGKVGLLLLSSFVEPGTVDETTTANHFTLLATIEQLFGLEKLGYANEPPPPPLAPPARNAPTRATGGETHTLQ